MRAAITGLGAAFPPDFPQAELWDRYFRDRFGGSRKAQVAWFRSGVERRAGVVRPDLEDVSNWPTSKRMERFVDESVPLARHAACAALEEQGIETGEVDRLVLATCTGYATPGVDVLLARRLGLRDDVERVQLGHMGCHAAIPALSSAADAAVARGATTLVVSVELTSLHLQPDLVDQEVPHALFADAAAAALVTPGQGGLEILDVASITDTDRSEAMRWDVTETGFRMILSPRVPGALARQLPSLVGHLLDRNGLSREAVSGWAVHPGGPRVLDTVERRLELAGDALAASRRVLAGHGNCSSATLLLVLRELELDRGAYAVALAFGPGLTLWSALLQRH